MSATDGELRALLDRERIRDCVARVARGEDRRDGRAISACFWPDAAADFGIFRGTFAEYLDWVVPGAEAVTNTQHFLGQSVIELDGNKARVESQVISYHRVYWGESERDIVLGGRYLDRMEMREGDWRIAERTMLYDWFRDWGESVDWSQGVMGMPLSADHFSGRAVGDFSEGFFAGAGGAPRDPG